ncbi:MAG: hypothetical protein EHM12_05170 [Dehalococcoidia bacterium]|nr:MAG: hypothetical protein EHM12_05170 [Dehalococcoidia bacterium]
MFNIICFSFAILGVTFNPAFFIPAMIIYSFVWIFIYFLFGKYSTLARDIVSQTPDQITQNSNLILEKGILSQMILGDEKAAIETLEPALKLEQGEPGLWFLYGMTMLNMEMYSSALTAFDKALKELPDKKLKKDIEKYRKEALKIVGP